MYAIFITFGKYICNVEFQTHEERLRSKHALENKISPKGVVLQEEKNTIISISFLGVKCCQAVTSLPFLVEESCSC